MKTQRILSDRNLFLASAALGLSLLAGCGAGSGDNEPLLQKPLLSLDLELPDSVTGGKPSAASRIADKSLAARGLGEPCAFVGADDDDPFRNGYQMTRFMVSAIATWTCIADILIEVADVVAHDGVVHETDNDLGAADFDADDPTHYSISDDSTTQTTIRFYYSYDRAAPPRADEDPQLFISWDTADNGDVVGRLIIDGDRIDSTDSDPDQPSMMRMDFNYTGDEKIADMFLRFPNDNPWADGLRIQVSKDLNGNLLEQVFVARGLMNMKAQFAPLDGIDDTPELHMYTVSDGFGEGAAVADFRDIALPLELNADTGNHLGNYLLTKNDIYFFDDNQDWDWIEKTISSSEFRSARTTPPNGGTFIPFDPSLDIIATGLGLGETYFTGSECAVVGDDCSALLNAVFADGFSDQEPNQGADPLDWRSDAVANPLYLNTVFPNGRDWHGAFEYEFTPLPTDDLAAPELPDPSTLGIPFGDFSGADNPARREVVSFGNWAFSAINVGVWNTIIGVGMAIPAASFAEAFNHFAVPQSDGSWEWRYNVVSDAVYTARLNGKLVNDQVQWKMYVSRVGAFKNFLWYSGEHNRPATSGSWRINNPPGRPGPMLSIEWTRDSSQGTESAKFTNIDPHSEEFGGFIAYAKTGLLPYDSDYDIFNKGLNNITGIEWSSLDHDGRVRDQLRYGDGDWHCWNTSLQDVACP